MSFKTKNSLLAGLGLVLCAPVLAQSQESTLEEIIVISNRIPVPARRVATSVSVIDSEEIQDHGNINLSSVLRQSTAVGASSNGGVGSTSALRIRGEEGFRTLAIFDGLKLADPSAPQVQPSIEHILSQGIGRIEILRGPQGLGYGADAGGVISISSVSTEPGTSVSVQGESGSRGSRNAGVTLATAGDKADFFFSAQDIATDGFNVRESDTVLRDDDGYENISIHIRTGIDLGNGWRTEVVHRDVAGAAEYDGCFSGVTVHDCESIYELQASRLSLQYGSDAYSHSFAYSQTETEREDLALSALAFDSTGELQRFEYVGAATELPGFDLVYGIDLEREKNGSVERDNAGYYLEYLSDFSTDFFLTAGLRHDDNDDYDAHTSYRISAAYLVSLQSGQLKWKSSYGTGFRAPSLFEIDYNAGPFAFPPASGTNLEEETSRGIEAGLEYTANSGLYLELVWFNQKVEDAILFDLSGFSGYLQDTGTSSSDGVEFTADLPLGEQFVLSGNYTYNETERPDGTQRLRRPEHLANLGLRYTSSDQRWHVNGFYRIARDAIDEVFGAPAPLEDYEVLDITASYAFSDSIEIFARMENATDASYAEVIGFRAPERASYLGFRLEF